jgi:metallophosphoesterase superfamily enzyme
MSGMAAVSVLDAAENLPLDFGGERFEPLPSGALYWPAERALLVADLHLEKLSSFAPRGQFLPPYDTGLTLARLAGDLLRTGA